MKVYKLNLGLGIAMFAAEDTIEVLYLIAKHSDLKYMFRGISARDILKDVEEIPGYTISGKPGVIAFYRE